MVKAEGREMDQARLEPRATDHAAPAAHEPAGTDDLVTRLGLGHHPVEDAGVVVIISGIDDHVRRGARVQTGHHRAMRSAALVLHGSHRQFAAPLVADDGQRVVLREVVADQHASRGFHPLLKRRKRLKDVCALVVDRDDNVQYRLEFDTLRRRQFEATRQFGRLHKAPDIDQRLAARVEMLIGRVGSAEDQDVAALDHLGERQQLGVGLDERIGGQHLRRVERQGPLELVAERGADVVDIGLERHPEQPHGHRAEIVFAAKLLDDVEDQAFVDQHRRVAEPELVARERRELHRVLEEARARSKAGAGYPRGPRIIRLHRPQDRRVVGTSGIGDHVELVGRGEFDVPIGIGEKLRELGFDRLHADHFGRKLGEKLGRLRLRFRRRSADDLRQGQEFRHAAALHDALGTISDAEPPSLAVEVIRQPIRRARIDRGAQDDQPVIPKMGKQLVDAVLDRGDDGIEEFVNRGPDRHDHGPCRGNVLRPPAKAQCAAGQRAVEERLRVLFDERQLAALQRVERLRVAIVDRDVEAAIGKAQHQRNADVAGPADHGDIAAARSVFSGARHRLTP